MSVRIETTKLSSKRGFGRVTAKKAATNKLRSPWIAPAQCIAFFTVVYAAASWLVLQDDVSQTHIEKTALMRIDAGQKAAQERNRNDLIVARQLQEKKLLANRVEKLQAHFQSLNKRQKHVTALLDRASKFGAETELKTDTIVTGAIIAKPVAQNALRLATISPKAEVVIAKAGPDVAVLQTIAKDPDRLAATEERITQSEAEQIKALKRARKKAKNKAIRIAKLLKKRGVALPRKLQESVGGPLIELKSGDAFLDTMQSLDETLASLSRMRNLADTLPHGSPVPGKKISSRYGGRSDPFTGRRAVHGGLDFRAKRGTIVQTTASGTVVKAGRLGGYGKLVEIDHGNGYTTRYAHLSRISVKKGQKISRGTRIGKVGSTGRSTGPHLHYEVRRKGRTHDPLGYVRLAKKLKPLL